MPYIGKTIIPIDPETNEPRQGVWKDSVWIPSNPKLLPLPSQTNPNFSLALPTWWSRPQAR